MIKERDAIGMSAASKDRPVQKLLSEHVLEAPTEVKMDLGYVPS